MNKLTKSTSTATMDGALKRISISEGLVKKGGIITTKHSSSVRPPPPPPQKPK